MYETLKYYDLTATGKQSLDMNYEGLSQDTVKMQVQVSSRAAVSLPRLWLDKTVHMVC